MLNNGRSVIGADDHGEQPNKKGLPNLKVGRSDPKSAMDTARQPHDL